MNEDHAGDTYNSNTRICGKPPLSKFPPLAIQKGVSVPRGNRESTQLFDALPACLCSDQRRRKKARKKKTLLRVTKTGPCGRGSAGHVINVYHMQKRRDKNKPSPTNSLPCVPRAGGIENQSQVLTSSDLFDAVNTQI